MDNIFGSAAQNSGGIPMWVWVLAVIIVIVVAIVWTLREEESASGSKPEGKAQEPASPSVKPVVTQQEPPAGREEPVAAPEPVEDIAPEMVEQTAAPEPIVEAKPAEPVQPQPKARPDNLKRINGIGPKIEKLLKDNGITTFAQLAQTDVSRLQAILDEAEYDLADPTTWPEQAQELASG